jgi:hypothetical protein
MLIGLSACEFYYHDPVYSSRDRIIGRYDMEEYSETFRDVTRYTLWIERSSRGADAIWIDNFYASNIRVRAHISYDRITIPRQTVNGYDVEGVGSIFGNRITDRSGKPTLLRDHRVCLFRWSLVLSQSPGWKIHFPTIVTAPVILLVPKQKQGVELISQEYPFDRHTYQCVYKRHDS